jgi:hypothetical protein
MLMRALTLCAAACRVFALDRMRRMCITSPCTFIMRRRMSNRVRADFIFGFVTIRGQLGSNRVGNGWNEQY